MARMVLTGVAGETQEKRHLGILLNLRHSLLTGQAMPLHDGERTIHLSHRLRLGTSRGAELKRIRFFQHIPWHHGGEDDPTVGRVQRAAKRHMKLFD
jgi:hypothetical protein